MRFNEGLQTHLADRLVVTQFHDEHSERDLLAFVYGHLRRARLAGRALRG
jgi:hypothetical protein